MAVEADFFLRFAVNELLAKPSLYLLYKYCQKHEQKACFFIWFVCAEMTEIVPYVYNVPSSSKNKKLFSHSLVHPGMITPNIMTPEAQIKYNALKHNLAPGIGVSFHTFSDLLDNFHKVGWECLVKFSSTTIYPSLIAEFYSHMEFSRDFLGTLHHITTYVQNQKIIIDQQFLIEALHIDPIMLDFPKVNHYVNPLDHSVINCLDFKRNLSVATDQLIPAFLFDVPVSVGIEYLTAKGQFLGKIVRNNFMPVRFDRKMDPTDLDMIKCILTESMPINLPHYLLTSFEHCYMNNCMGFGLLLTSIFQHLDLDLLSVKGQCVKTTNVTSHLNLPPKPLFLFTNYEKDSFGSTNLEVQLDSINSMQQMILANQHSIQTQLDTLTASVQTMQHFISNMVDNQVPPYIYGDSAGSVHPNYHDPMDQTPVGENLPPLNTHFSPLNLSDW